MKKVKLVASFVSCFLILLINIPVSHAVTSVNGYDYAPYYFYDYYSYAADFMEFNDYEATLNFSANEENIYQFNYDNSATNTIYVYQLQEDGVYELAYFPHENSSIDYRYHSDSMNEFKSLILPATISIGQVFYQGYAQDVPVTVVDIVDSFSLNGKHYENILVLEKEDNNYTYTTYLAPYTGIIWQNEVSHDGSFNITTELVESKNQGSVVENNQFSNPGVTLEVLNYEEAVDYANNHPERVAEFKAVVEGGIGIYHDFTREQLNALPADAYFNTLVYHKMNLPTGGDPGTTAHFLETLYPEILSSSRSIENQNETITSSPQDLIDKEAVIDLLMTSDIMNNSLSYEDAEGIVNLIISDIQINHNNYSVNNRQAFSNAIDQYIPSNFSTGLKISIPDHFYSYIDSLIASSTPTISNPSQTSSSNTDFSVDLKDLNGPFLFESFYPTFSQIEIDFTTGKLSYQADVSNDPGLYDVQITMKPVDEINVAYFNEEGSRKVHVITNLNIQGPTAHYHLGTNSAYLFYNRDGGISLALPDLTNVLPVTSQPTWVEYHMVLE